MDNRENNKFTLKNVLESNNPKLVYLKARESKSNSTILKLQREIIRLNDAKYIYLFANDILESDKVKLMNAIIKTGDLLYIYYFARDVKRLKKIHIKVLEDFIVESKNPEFILMFARDVSRCDVNRLTDTMIEINDYDWLMNYMRAVNCEGRDIFYLTMATRGIIYELVDDDIKAKYWAVVEDIYCYKPPERFNRRKFMEQLKEEIKDFFSWNTVRNFFDFGKF